MRIISIALLLAVLLVLPLLAPRLESHQALIDHRQTLSVNTVESASGSTRFETFGDRRKPSVFLIHSFNGYLETWQPNIDALVRAGYHVVAYDLFGRGLSDRPRRPLSLEVFHEQIDALRQHLEIDKPIYLVGASFGCVIAADYATRHPGRVRALALTGPAGWPNPEDNTAQLVKLPYVADMLFYYAGKPMLLGKIEHYLLDERERRHALAQWKVYEQYAGVTRSALSTLRHSPVLDNSAGWKKLGRSDIPTLFIWGRQDSSFPYHHADTAKKLIPQAQVIAIDKAEHWVNVDQAEAVNNALIEFFNGR